MTQEVHIEPHVLDRFGELSRREQLLVELLGRDSPEVIEAINGLRKLARLLVELDQIDWVFVRLSQILSVHDGVSFDVRSGGCIQARSDLRDGLRYLEDNFARAIRFRNERQG